MSTDLREKLGHPYPRPLAESPEDYRATVLGVRIGSHRALRDSIESDFKTEGYGMNWIDEEGEDPRRRILIGDYLSQVLRSIQINMVEAVLHKLELFTSIDREEENTSIRVYFGSSNPFRPVHRGRSVADDLAVAEVDMHLGGLFRALVSALDCCGAALIGVCAIPRSIYKVRHDQLMESIPGLIKQAAPPQREWYQRIVGLPEQCGPVGWDRYVVSMRHAMIHRARRLLAVEFEVLWPRMAIGPDYDEHHARLVYRLPSRPEASELDDWRMEERPPVLHEDLRSSVDAALGCVTSYVSKACDLMREAWVIRRQGNVIQPSKQWKLEDQGESAPFRGFAPDSAPAEIGAIFSHGDVQRRFMRSAMFDGERHKWGEWDGSAKDPQGDD